MKECLGSRTPGSGKGGTSSDTARGAAAVFCFCSNAPRPGQVFGRFHLLVIATAIPLFFWRKLAAAEAASSQPWFAEMDKMSGVKGWNISFPSFGDTIHAAGLYGKSETWSATIAYLARLSAGVYLTLGLSYTANPSQALYFGPSQANPSQRFEGNALNSQATLSTAF